MKNYIEYKQVGQNMGGVQGPVLDPLVGPKGKALG